MQTGSHSDRIIEAVRVSSRPLDDDQLADRTGISRQSVNQICRELPGAGIVRRRPGPDGKIVNEWFGTTTASEPGQLPPGSPREQRDVERELGIEVQDAVVDAGAGVIPLHEVERPLALAAHPEGASRPVKVAVRDDARELRPGDQTVFELSRNPATTGPSARD